MNRLKGKYALITGGSQGLGRRLAIDFASEGAAAISIVARRIEYLNAVRDQIHEIYPSTKVLVIAADMSRQEDIERTTAITLGEFGGRLDILINNASSIGPSPLPYLLDYPVEDFRYVINTNLIGPFLMIKKLLPAMIENGGSIINVTSDAGAIGYPGWGAYGISKFGIEGMSQTWAAELDGSGVRVNYVDPGNMNTAMHRAAEPNEDPTQWTNPEEVTEVFIYLGSDESQNVNGKRFKAQEKDTWMSTTTKTKTNKNDLQDESATRIDLQQKQEQKQKILR